MSDRCVTPDPMTYLWNPWQHETDNPKLIAVRLIMPNRLDPTNVTDLIWGFHPRAHIFDSSF